MLGPDRVLRGSNHSLPLTPQGVGLSDSASLDLSLLLSETRRIRCHQGFVQMSWAPTLDPVSAPWHAQGIIALSAGPRPGLVVAVPPLQGQALKGERSPVLWSPPPPRRLDSVICRVRSRGRPPPPRSAHPGENSLPAPVPGRLCPGLMGCLGSSSRCLRSPSPPRPPAPACSAPFRQALVHFHRP